MSVSVRDGGGERGQRRLQQVFCCRAKSDTEGLDMEK